MGVVRRSELQFRAQHSQLSLVILVLHLFLCNMPYTCVYITTVKGIDGKSRTHWFSSQLTFNQIAICVGSSRQCFQWGYSKRGDAFRNKKKLQKINISQNNFAGKLLDLSKNTELLYSNLSGNHFTGTLTNLSDFFNVSAAAVVDFSKNFLIG
uniref:Leucine-rich repeat-containing N-terminal plant-type domain-containing protein n=1 Tax=Physcomitrium patens TaxID=3218 RepID=A0A2K1IWS8_PHYPA|nr:hypothetical protein PHYPA_023552 [Physcomitrium patens]